MAQDPSTVDQASPKLRSRSLSRAAAGPLAITAPPSPLHYALVFAACVLPAPALAHTDASDPVPTFENAFVFGDSLSDSGNIAAATDGAIPDSPPYEAGRFSNGPVWIEHVVDDLAPFLVDPGAPSQSFAAGGARTDSSFDLSGQVPPGVLAQLFLFRISSSISDRTIGPDDLVVVWAGANNLFDASGLADRDASGFPDEASARQYLFAESDAALADIDEAIGSLVKDGARILLVPNLPDLGSIPRFNARGDRSATMTAATRRFNAGLADILAKQAGADVNVISMDVETLFEIVRNRPGEFGLANVTDACINQVAEVDPATLTLCAPDREGQNTYLFWDEVHPTAATHEIIARAALGLLTTDQALEAPMVFTDAAMIAARALADDLSGHARAPIASDGSDVRPVSLFLAASQGWGKRRADGFAKAASFDQQALTGGIEARPAEAVRIGLSLGYARSDHVVSGGTQFDLSAWQASAFAVYARDGFHLDASLARGWLDYHNYVRATTLSPIRGRGRTDGDYWSATGRAGYTARLGGLNVGFDAGLRYIDGDIAGFTETEAPILGLEVGPQGATSLAALAGLSVSGGYSAGSWRLVPHARVTYEAELDGSREGSARLLNNTADPVFVSDKLLDEDRVAIEAGLALSGKALRFALAYRERWSDRRDGRERRVSGLLTVPF